MKGSIIPKYEIVEYKLNTETKYYEKQNEFNHLTDLPDELKLEGARKPFLIKQGAQNIIRGRIRNKIYLFFTGLIPTSLTKVFTGDDGYNKPLRKSLVIFVFSNDLSNICIYLFKGYTKQPAPLRQFIAGTFKNSILR